jgi:hypothetical protein
MLRIPAVVTMASFLLAVGAIGPTSARASTVGGVNLEKKISVIVVVNPKNVTIIGECKVRCPKPR